MIVRESIFEAVQFQRGVDPKSAMSLGLEEQIKTWYRDAYDHDPGEDLIYDIMKDDELDFDTKEKWVLFLISKGYNWDCEEWAEMMNQGIDFIPALPDGYKRNFGDLNYFKKNGKNYIQFSGWEDWADYVEENREISREFIEAILSGDSFEYFDSDYHPEVLDSDHWILKDNQSVEMIKEKFLELGGEEKITEDPEEMIRTICTDSEFEDLEYAISYALASSQQSADESEAYNDILKNLKDHFDIGDSEWNGESHISEISQEGFSKLLDAGFDGNNKLDYSPPYYGYQGDVDYDTFRSELENRLSDI